MYSRDFKNFGAENLLELHEAPLCNLINLIMDLLHARNILRLLVMILSLLGRQLVLLNNVDLDSVNSLLPT